MRINCIFQEFSKRKRDFPPLNLESKLAEISSYRLWKHRTRNVRQSHHTRRQARRSCNPCFSSKSHRGLWDFYREYARRRANATGMGIVTQNSIKRLSLTECSPRVCSIRDNSFLSDYYSVFTKMCCPYYNTRLSLG